MEAEGERDVWLGVSLCLFDSETSFLCTQYFNSESRTYTSHPGKFKVPKRPEPVFVNV
jgi:hypothetical protein